ncbi:MAG: formylglycine-generating enzyme family protein [Thiothrix sp.]|nr:MAG: formylglycine-generating enzyme family protein [Thiothrix sp.]
MEALHLPRSTSPVTHALAAAELKTLQAQTASQYGLPTFFQDSLKSGLKGPKLAVIPAGQFEMGSKPTEFGHRREEYPQHTIHLDYDFAIGQLPIMAEEFEIFRTATEWQKRPELIWHQGRYPVINVRMSDVKLYLHWLSEQTGQHYRLPTEPEWEYAARAGTTTPFCYGSTVSCKEVNFNPIFPYQEALEKKRWYLPRCIPSVSASELGLHEPNQWGLYDVHGNVWEFTSTHWSSSHLGAYRDGSPNHHGDPYWYVTKGGSWFDPAVLARSAARKKRYLDELDTNLGFRVVRELT